jgi:hypothetical protein
MPPASGRATSPGSPATAASPPARNRSIFLNQLGLPGVK